MDPARSEGAMPNQYFCTSCGTVGKPRVRNRGSSAIEIILWLLLLIPGICYTIWRMGRKDRYCRACGAQSMIPADSPMAGRYLDGTSQPTSYRQVAGNPSVSGAGFGRR